MKTKLTYYLHIDDRSKYTDLSKREKLDAVQAKINKEIDSSHITKNYKKADIIVVWWGDGFFLQAQREFSWNWILLYGLNAGRKWNILNSLDHPLPKTLEDVNIYSYPLGLYTIFTQDWLSFSWFYCSEITIGWDKDSYYEFCVTLNKKTISKNTLNGSALIINTPQWMTGYAGPMNEPLLALEADTQRIIWGNIAGFDYLHFNKKTVTIQDTLGRKELHVSIDGTWGPSFKQVKKIILQPSINTFQVAYHVQENYKKKRNDYRKQKNTSIIWK